MALDRSAVAPALEHHEVARVLHDLGEHERKAAVLGERLPGRCRHHLFGLPPMGDLDMHVADAEDHLPGR